MNDPRRVVGELRSEPRTEPGPCQMLSIDLYLASEDEVIDAVWDMRSRRVGTNEEIMPGDPALYIGGHLVRVMTAKGEA